MARHPNATTRGRWTRTPWWSSRPATPPGAGLTGLTGRMRLTGRIRLTGLTGLTGLTERIRLTGLIGLTGLTERMRLTGLIGLMGLTGLALLAGCASGADQAFEGGAYDGFAEDVDRSAEVEDAAFDLGATDAPSPGPAVVADGAPDASADGADAVRPVGARTGRRVVRSAHLELVVEDGIGAADAVAALAERRGGFVAETDLERDATGIVRGSITLRVPSAQLFGVVEELDALAVAVPVRRIEEQDVTAESTDLEARLTNLTTYELELRALLADVRETTTRPDDLLTVFERIRSVRAEIDQSEARLAIIDDAVALSTVRVWLQPAGSAIAVLDPTWAPSETIREALTVTARALSAVADAGIRFLLTVLPVGLLLSAPAVVAALAWRRVRGERRRARSVGTPGAPAAP